MIAKTRGPLSVKDHSFGVCAHCLPGITIGTREKPGAPYSPLQERPASLSSILDRLQRGCANFALKPSEKSHERAKRLAIRRLIAT
jgi:hypothetical protein